jgi:hypothetical protein
MALREGQKCLVADIDFCKANSRYEAETALRTQVHDLMLSWLFFENDFHACQANIRRRASQSIEDNLRALHEYRALYQIPIGAQVIPVWQSGALSVASQERHTGVAVTPKSYDRGAQ